VVLAVLAAVVLPHPLTVLAVLGQRVKVAMVALAIREVRHQPQETEVEVVALTPLAAPRMHSTTAAQACHL
jgi:hypothetical protein